MKIYKEESLRSFEFWSGAKQTAEILDGEQLDTLEDILIEIYPDGMSETEVNDFFWFETEEIAQLLGYEDFEALEEDNK